MGKKELEPNHRGEAVTYHCAPSTKWAVETHGIVLVNERTGAVLSVGYPQAAIWDLITRGYFYDCIVRMVTAITSLQADEVEKLIVGSLETWVKTGFLVRENLWF